MDSVSSVHGVRIRLTDERWRHISDRHPELTAHLDDLLLTVSDPDAVVRAPASALFALRRLTGDRYVVVLYRETDREDGFVITSWLTSRADRFLRREVLWTRPSSS